MTRSTRRSARAVPSRVRNQPPRPPRAPALDPTQAAFLAARLAEATREDPRWGELATALLKLGGRALVVPRDFLPPVAFGALLDGAQGWARADASRAPVTMRKLEPTVAARWSHAPRRYSIARGFALDEDGLWRSHTWLVRGARAIELGPPRLRYLGAVLSDDEATRWSAEVLGDDAPGSERRVSA